MGALKGLGVELGNKGQIEMPALIGLSPKPSPLPPHLNQMREGREAEEERREGWIE